MFLVQTGQTCHLGNIFELQNQILFLCISDSGVSLENGVFVAAVVPGSPAAKEGSLTVGDRIIAVSHKNAFACLNFYLF